MASSRGRAGKLRGWRKIAGATWGVPNDPQIYGDLEVDATGLLRFVDAARAAGVKLTITHLAGKAIAHAYAESPDLNVRLFRGRLIPRDSVDIFFIVSTGGGGELSGVKVSDADRKPVVEIAGELARRAGSIHAGEDQDLGKTKAMLDKMPLWLLKIMVRVAAW
ncbi:MAG TPA: 2-oxo acid dehydrogenase subunit E2, partial [Egibacteraceae bacterium]|nr:2-oxo acid dehydrogenase subunit E2 [Egibacteraceae bacterium]